MKYNNKQGIVIKIRTTFKRKIIDRVCQFNIIY